MEQPPMQEERMKKRYLVLIALAVLLSTSLLFTGCAEKEEAAAEPESLEGKPLSIMTFTTEFKDQAIVAVREDVLGRHEQFFHRRHHAALEEDRLLRSADGVQQRIVLHVARADLRMSAYVDTRGTASGDITSVTISSPVCSRASARILSPSCPIP